MWYSRMRLKNIIGTGLIALLWLALLGGLILYAGRLMRAYDGISIRISDTPITEDRLKRLTAQEDGDLALTAAWSRGKAIDLTAEGLETTIAARPVTAYGDVRQIGPMRLVSGSYLTDGDARGCLVTADAAMALFHSVETEGARVSAGGKTYTVRGVIDAYEPMLIARGDGAAAYENLELIPADLSGGAAQAEAFLYRHGLSGAYTVVQNGMYAKILFGVAFLPAALACLFAAGALIKAYGQRRGKAVFLWLLLPAAGLLTLAALILRATFYWPQIYLPTKCSDFAFWSELMAGFQTTWRAMTLMTPLPKDVQFFHAARIIVCGLFLTLTAEIGLYRRICRMARSPQRYGSEGIYEAGK